MKAFIALDSWLFQKSGSFKNFVKNDVTIDVSGMTCMPLGELYPASTFPWVYHIAYGVGSTLLVLRSDGYARCLETAGRVTIRILRFFVKPIIPVRRGIEFHAFV